MTDLSQPTPTQFRRGVLAFRKHESRDAMYRMASFLVEHFWDSPRDLADGLGVLLLTWNQAHYRYGRPDLESLEKFLTTHRPTLQKYRHREIATFSKRDHATVNRLFTGGLKALAARQGKKIHRSPVAVAKALHLLAPSFFPLWDLAIAKAYSCYYNVDPVMKYLGFMSLSQELVAQLRVTIDSLLDEKTPLKVFDEYNYAKFTKGWV